MKFLYFSFSLHRLSLYLKLSLFHPLSLCAYFLYLFISLSPSFAQSFSVSFLLSQNLDKKFDILAKALKSLREGGNGYWLKHLGEGGCFYANDKQVMHTKQNARMRAGAEGFRRAPVCTIQYCISYSRLVLYAPYSIVLAIQDSYCMHHTVLAIQDSYCICTVWKGRLTV